MDNYNSYFLNIVRFVTILSMILFVNCYKDNKATENKVATQNTTTEKTSSKKLNKKTINMLINFDSINNYIELKTACKNIYIDSIVCFKKVDYGQLSRLEKVAYISIFENPININNIPDSLFSFLNFIKDRLTYPTYHDQKDKKNKLIAYEYIKANKNEFSWYEPAGDYMYQIFQAILNLESKGMKKENVCKILKKYYKWESLEGNNYHEIEDVIKFVKGTEIENSILKEIAKYYSYKINCNQTIDEHTDGTCGPWPEYQNKLDSLINSANIDSLQDVKGFDCNCYGC